MMLRFVSVEYISNKWKGNNMNSFMTRKTPKKKHSLSFYRRMVKKIKQKYDQDIIISKKLENEKQKLERDIFVRKISMMLG